MYILVIDDDALTRKSFHHILTQEGHVVKLAKDGSDAAEQLSKHIPELIICDLLMPHISGVTFIQVLRDYLHYHIPVIIISALDKGKLIADNLNLDNIDFMSKPVHFDGLIQKINNYSKIKTI
jgi:DNA-binding response OmpR family regulator